DLLGRPGGHVDGEDCKHDRAADRNGAAAEVEQAQENSTMAVTTAVRTIRRPTARCVSASRCLVFSRNGTRATLGPMPISRSRSSLTTSPVSITAKFIEKLAFATALRRPRRFETGRSYAKRDCSWLADGRSHITCSYELCRIPGLGL